MSKKSILSIIFLLLFSFSIYSQKAEPTKIAVDDKVGLIFFSTIFNEYSEIIELRNFKGEIPSGCKTEPNTVEAKICDALKQFAKEQNIKILLDGDEMDKCCSYPSIGDNLVNVTEDFVKFYNTHFVKNNE